MWSLRVGRVLGGLSRGAAGVACLGAIVASVGCYDSMGGERERSQRRNAAHVAPAELHARAADHDDARARGTWARPSASRVLRMRVYVTPAYAAQTLDAERKLRDLVEDANAVLETSLGARLEVESTRPWSPPVSEDSLAAVVEAVRAKDAAEETDLVVAMIGGLAKVSSSFHEIGMAPLAGKYVVVRAAGSLDEHQAVESAFDELSVEERANVQKGLRRHRATAVFLHEVGHAFGAMHETRRSSVMYPEYGRAMAGFSAEASRVMRIGLAHRSTPTTAAEGRAWATELRDYLKDAPPVWVPSERAEMIARLDEALASDARAATRRAAASEPAVPPEVPVARAASAASTPSPSAAVAPSEASSSQVSTPTAPPARPVAGLRARDEALYARVLAAHRKGDANEAWALGRALFDAYPKVYEVQDLRCQIAMKRGGEWSAARKECEPLMRLSVAPSPAE